MSRRTTAVAGRAQAPQVRPRTDWGADLPPTRALRAEEDVRFLLVHHTATPNVPASASVDQLRSFYRHHTGTKGWPDLAYNFLVDAGGQVWEGRQGSLAAPVRGDATGGSQGHAELCCFIGDLSSTRPTPAAVTAMTGLLAWLAERDGIDLGEGSTVRFTSRGSDRWPAGTTVTTEPVAGHRDMSLTTCPGDVGYGLIAAELLPGARRLQGAGGPTAGSSSASTRSSTTPSSTTPLSTTPSSTTGGSTGTPSSSTRPGGGTSDQQARSRSDASAARPTAGSSTGAEAASGTGDDDLARAAIAGGGTLLVGGLSWVLARRLARERQR